MRAADAAGVPFTLSTVGICRLDEVGAAASKPFWFQLYMMRDRGAVKELLERATVAGCRTLVFTVDLPVPGMRHRDVRNGMLANSLKAKLVKAWQVGRRPGWVYDVALRGKPHSFGNLADLVPDPSNFYAFKAWIDDQFDTSVTWKDIAWLRGIWKGKLLLKGILEAEDGKSAADVGADGVIVSNHGGRQLDSVASSISKLPTFSDAVGDRTRGVYGRRSARRPRRLQSGGARCTRRADWSTMGLGFGRRGRGRAQESSGDDEARTRSRYGVDGRHEN